MNSFVQHTKADREHMLQVIGAESFADLVGEIPERLRLTEDLPLEAGLSESETLDRIAKLAGRNRSAGEQVCFAGGGFYDVCVPSATGALLSRPEFMTAYTPYQAEVSQGTLQAIYEFQTIVCRLMALDLANASMYDCGTALAEAVLVAKDSRPGRTVLVSPHLHPQAMEVLRTITAPSGLVIRELPAQGARTDVSGLTPDALDSVCAVVLQHPNYLGALEDMRLAGASLEAEDAPLFVASVDLSSLALLQPPGEYGADIAVAEAQSLGIPMSFGGPGAGVMAARKSFLRRMPGRIAGIAPDAKGRRAFTLTLQTREQHIRRARATSNICTNQALTALAATISTALLGETGRKLAAELSAKKAHALAERLTAIDGLALADPDAPFFREFAVRLPDCAAASEVLRRMAEHGILAGIPVEEVPGGGEGLLIAVTEKRLWSEVDAYAKAMGCVLADCAAKERVSP
ncbi:MAG: aminomethyl-transferring glycine dehydrogenase subunit GcvPA [Gemmatimonadota bacterium]|jgi:glycine dehydrogenase subunit 1|nr:aminomethyl-transferring glycine dehydrogenase subunit GcvPA [Gemmatimonadota bacterium]